MGLYSFAIQEWLKSPNLQVMKQKLGIGGSGSGDVVGPASATDNAIARYDLTTGKIIQDSAPIVQDDGRISTVTDPTQPQDAATKNYVDTMAPGTGDVVGPASSVDDNIATFDGVTGKLIQDSGVPIVQVPSSGEKDALAGTDGAPSAANPYVTDSDPRNTNDRDPNPHAPTHSLGGGDQVDVTDLAGYPGGTTDFLRADGTFATPAGSGSVTSVALTMPTAIFDVAGSPITTSGTFAVTFDNQNANLVFAGPTSGGAATPTMRALVSADIPGGAAWDVVIVKSSDQTVTNSIVPVNDTELFTPLDANSHYLVELCLIYSANNTTGDYRGRFTIPTINSGVSVGFWNGYTGAGTISIVPVNSGSTVFPSADIILAAAATDIPVTTFIQFTILTEGVAADLQWQFANSAAAIGRTSTTRTGATLRVKKLYP